MPAPRPAHVDPLPLLHVRGLLGEVQVVGSLDDVVVTGTTHDSRAVRPGDLYVALPGVHAHGADFAADARGAGAVAVLTDRTDVALTPALIVPDPRGVLGPVAAAVYGDPSAAMAVYGVTGTNGKTTSTYLLEAALAAAGHSCGVLGTVETRVGATVLPAAHTTPEATDLQALLALMRERGADVVAMEVSSHGLALGRVDGTRFAAAVFTNLGMDHLDFHKDGEDYYRAKARLFDGRAAVAVINIDDASGRRLAGEARGRVVTTSGHGDPAATWRATDVVLDADGTSFRMVGPDTVTDVRIQLPGAHNVANALGVLVALAETGIDLGGAAEGVSALRGVPGRLEPVDAGQPWRAYVDYAHTPDALFTVLGALRVTTTGRLIVVFGCGGDRDKGKRAFMGSVAAESADVVVVTSDNPRTEDPMAIIGPIVAAARQVDRAELHVEPDRAAAIAFAVGLARPGDTVLVAGKGHEREQIFADRVVPFDDRAILAGAIRTAS